MRLRINGPHAIVVAIAARIASREGRAPSDSRNFKNSRFAAAIADRLEHGFGTRIVRPRQQSADKHARDVFVVNLDLRRKIKGLRRGRLASPEWAKRSIRAWLHRQSARSTRFGPTIAAAAAMTVLGELPASRAASAASQRRIPYQVHFRRNGDVEHGAIILCRRSRARAEARNSLPAAAARDRARYGRARS